MQRYQDQAATGLSSSGASTRADAVRKLAGERGAGLNELLLALLADSDESVRLQTLAALMQSGAVAALLGRIKALESDESDRVRQRATRIAESMERRSSLRR